MIRSILDNDFYKFTMGQAVFQHYPNVEVKYHFVNRGHTKFPENFGKILSTNIINMSLLKLLPDEFEYLNTLNIFSPTYLEFLKNYRFNPNEVNITQDGANLDIEITGPWYSTIFWEVPLMATISELYYEITEQNGYSKDDEVFNKASFLEENCCRFADFGTRRRYSYENHKKVVEIFSNYGNFVGTSNVHLAMLNEGKPIGTLAHEWYSFHGAKHGYRMANEMALKKWVEVYHGYLGITLTDTFTTDVFLKTFDSYWARLFDGIRQDSGDPFEIGLKLIQHYNRLGINPKHKTIVFSDSLNPEKCVELNSRFDKMINVLFGIGTNLTNDVGVKPLNIVIKLFECKIKDWWYPCVKLSDTAGKHTGYKEEIDICKNVLGI